VVSPSSNFEFEALRLATNYRHALLREFEPYLTGDVIEVGAGIGQFTELLLQSKKVTRVTAIEPDASFCQQLQQRLAPNRPSSCIVLNGTVSAVAPGTSCDAIVSVNVLEHIEDDAGELSGYARLLKERRGALCLFVPARPEIYAPIDKDFGHFRRYTKAGLRQKLQQAGLKIERLHYFNFIGYFGWWFNFCFLRQRSFSESSVRLFDRIIFPIGHAVESRLFRPPFGQSLLTVARSR